MTRVDIPDARPRWSRRRVVALCSVVAVLAAVITAVAWAVREPVCDDQEGLVLVDDQCIGVADPTRAFDFDRPALRDVMERIRKQNEIAARDPEHVSIAVLLTLTPPGAHAIEPVEQVEHQLKGAVRAQAFYNVDDSPKVVLLPANAGEGFTHWEPAVDELLRRREAPDRLVAVTGFGQSLAPAQAALEVLSEHQVPLVASTMTSDALREVDGLLRPAPSNSRQAGVAALKAKEILDADAARAAPGSGGGNPGVVMITDKNEDDGYSVNLAAEFREQVGALDIEVLKTMSYDSRLKDIRVTFRGDQANICYASTRVFYFAGRGTHLSALVEALGDKPCEKGRELVILTGDDSPSDEQAAEDKFRAGLAGGIRIVQTDLSAPDLREGYAMLAGKGDEDRMSAKAIEDFTGDELPDYALDEAARRDDGTVLSYDAVLTALALVTKAVDPEQRKPLDHREVLKVIYTLSDANAVPGASGRLSYTSEGDAEDKVVPLVERTASGVVLVDVR
ncbi:hypothetical protein [Saccharothrix longispora]|uniref:hypothetical protein n=1 Tax=Saccharothrix longispora TaxID=33920 RepID=UPI0028FCFC64|nr:hypothetical protein [Saccharothrix longispora]MDU0288576.1 hypothetical protein [Saccharothrix longispora]